MALENELVFFEKNRQEWLTHYRGHFALVKGDRLLGTFTTFGEAFEAGVKEIGNQAFLIKEISERDEVVQFPALSVGMISARL